MKLEASIKERVVAQSREIHQPKRVLGDNGEESN